MPEKFSLVMGVDPGLQASGVIIAKVDAKGAVKVVEAQEIKTRAGWRFSQRIAFIYNNMEKIISAYDLEVMAIEKIYSHYRHPNTASLLAHARGVILLAAEKAKVKIVEFSNTHIKKAVLGKGSASAAQLRRMAAYLAGQSAPFSSQHLSDALSLVLAFAHTKRIKLEFL